MAGPGAGAGGHRRRFQQLVLPLQPSVHELRPRGPPAFPLPAPHPVAGRPPGFGPAAPPGRPRVRRHVGPVPVAGPGLGRRSVRGVRGLSPAPVPGAALVSPGRALEAPGRPGPPGRRHPGPGRWAREPGAPGAPGRRERQPVPGRPDQPGPASGPSGQRHGHRLRGHGHRPPGRGHRQAHRGDLRPRAGGTGTSPAAPKSSPCAAIPPAIRCTPFRPAPWTG